MPQQDAREQRSCQDRTSLEDCELRCRALEDELRRCELRYRLLTETMSQGVICQDAAGRITEVNPAAEEIAGQATSELLGRVSQELEQFTIREDGSTLPGAEHPGMRALATGVAVKDVVLGLFNPRMGGYRWLRVTAVPQFLDGTGSPSQVCSFLEEITAQRLAQKNLRQSELKFRWLFESNVVAIFFWKLDGTITDSNQAFCNLLGVDRDQCQSGRMNWRELTDPESLPRDIEALREVVRTGSCKPYEKTFCSAKEGRRILALISGAMMPGSRDEGIAFAVDLTELKRTEEALRSSEATLRLALEATDLGTFEFYPATGQLVWSDIAKRHYGLPPEAVGSWELFLRSIHPQDQERMVRLVEEALDPRQGGQLITQYRVIGVEDGKERVLAVRGHTYFEPHGEPLVMIGTCQDLSEILQVEQSLKDETAHRLSAVEELRKQERLLINQSRLAAMGEMIGNIAHQWRQPLNSLGLIVQELPRYYERGLFSKEYLDASVARALQVIAHMSQTIDGFRNFFRPSREKVHFQVSEIVDRIVSITAEAFTPLRLKIEVVADPEIYLEGYPNELSQVILNILVNAKDAAVERKVPLPRIRVRLFRERGRVVLTVADNAGGIPPDLIGRIFDPYFTTKGPEQGTGIGLFMSKTIIEKNMHGTLCARNTGEGAEFRIEI